MNVKKCFVILATLSSLSLADGISQAQVVPAQVAPVAPTVSTVNPYARTRVWNRRVRRPRRNRLRRTWMPGVGWVRPVY
jgi:hypothetical protein